MVAILSIIILLGILIFFHELGHFVVARLSGIAVTVFSLGFGPRLKGFISGGTEYRLSALPLGGYVKMKGENPGERLAGSKDEFQSRSVGTRAAVVIAGPAMNLILALVLFSVVFFIGLQVPRHLLEPPVIGYIAHDSPAQEAGFRVGDRIEALNGRKVDNWEKVEIAIATSPGRELKIGLVRDESRLTIPLTPMAVPTGEGFGGLGPLLEPIIGAVLDDSPAAEADLRPGDRITEIDGRPVLSWMQMAAQFQASPNQPLPLAIERGEESLELMITPRPDSTGVGKVGIIPWEETVTVRHSLGKSIVMGAARFRDLTWLTFTTLVRLVTFQISIKTLGGPIQIAQVSSVAARTGIPAFLSLMAFISLQLGIINLLPIPILDGGHLFFLTLEKVRGRPLSLKHRELIQQIGMAILITLMIIVSINDFRRILGP